MGRTAAAIILLVGILGLWAWLASRKRVEVFAGEVGLLYRNGRFEKELEPGIHRWFDLFGRTRWARVSLLPRSLGDAVLEVISKDRFAFRITVATLATVVDPRSYHESRPALPAKANARMETFPFVQGEFARLQPVLAAEVLQAVAQVTLEEFLANPAGALAGVPDQVAAVLDGARLDALKVTAITLPPETRKMFTEVERARREGLAALERARAEQASLRALANAARNLANNPDLARLRTLQTMESARGAKTFVLGELPRGAGLLDKS